MNDLAVCLATVIGVTGSLMIVLLAMNGVEQRFVGTVPFRPTRVGESRTDPPQPRSEPPADVRPTPRRGTVRARAVSPSATPRRGVTPLGRAPVRPVVRIEDPRTRRLALSGVCALVALVCVAVQARSPREHR
ncbi:hypothetical protein [Actinopolyspora mortivallis]|uniref:hypothetical protein n=1 Tax=Actinopolyspora mortivallis TaxID=33906 RepID=UPI0011B23749|nr:hypothetical protein [Actinopolyspora mortivallis]